jgi:5-methylcytosine-specific restriction endonuclease McrA
MARIREWLDHSDVRITPVLDLTRADAVDPHDPPAWMRELVILRDRTCVFPHCSRDARDCDLDHIDAYDEDGPPGQTHPDNLAPLCRRHHRAKTSGRWRYRRRRDGTYTWTDPLGHTYLTRPWQARDYGWR